MRRKRAALLTLCLLAGLVGSTILWLRAQQRQYALNQALIDAVVEGDAKHALTLVNMGADPNTCYMPRPVPSLPELVKQLLHRSSPPGNDGLTAFTIACGMYWHDRMDPIHARRNCPDDAPLIQVMLTNGGQVNALGKFHTTPLMWSVLVHHPKTVHLLLEHGAMVNARDDNGNTGLFWAVTADTDKDIIRQLLAHGADPNLSNKKGLTPLARARRMNRPALVALLKQYGARDTRKRH